MTTTTSSSSASSAQTPVVLSPGVFVQQAASFYVRPNEAEVGEWLARLRPSSLPNLEPWIFLKLLAPVESAGVEVVGYPLAINVIARLADQLATRRVR